MICVTGLYKDVRRGWDWAVGRRVAWWWRMVREGPLCESGVMARLVLLATVSAVLAVAQTAVPAGAPPAEVPGGVASTLKQDGIKVQDGSKVVGEFWFVTAAPSGPKSGEEALTLPTIPTGALLGVARLPARFADRIGTQLKGGVYTMRYGAYPQDGAHQGVEPQRDFLILSPVGEDTAPAGGVEFSALMDLSRKATGTAHPAVLSAWRVDGEFREGVSKVGESGDLVVQVKVGDVPLAVIVAGKNSH